VRRLWRGLCYWFGTALDVAIFNPLADWLLDDDRHRREAREGAERYRLHRRGRP
jgi:hypothetical protein